MVGINPSRMDTIKKYARKMIINEIVYLQERINGALNLNLMDESRENLTSEEEYDIKWVIIERKGYIIKKEQRLKIAQEQLDNLDKGKSLISSPSQSELF